MARLSKAEGEAIAARRERDEARAEMVALRTRLEEVWAVLSEATPCEEVFLARRLVQDVLQEDPLVLASLPGERGAELRAILKKMRGA